MVQQLYTENISALQPYSLKPIFVWFWGFGHLNEYILWFDRLSEGSPF